MREPVPADERRWLGPAARRKPLPGHQARGFGGTMAGRAEALQRFAPRAHR